MALKVADLGHTASSEKVHLQWTKRLGEEFYAQGDRERELDLPVSPLMDRHQQGSQAGISKSQVRHSAESKDNQELQGPMT